MLLKEFAVLRNLCWCERIAKKITVKLTMMTSAAAVAVSY